MRNLYDHSRTMFEKLDTILDYEDSELRCESRQPTGFHGTQILNRLGDTDAS